jgi:hypothetical protein
MRSEMPLSRNEAKDALQDIEKTQSRSSAAVGYRLASPHLIIWGIVWMIGYGASYFRPGLSPWWPLLVVVGIVGSSWIGSRKHPARVGGYNWRYIATALALFLFVVSVFAIMPPATPSQIDAFFPILVAFCYALMGIWTNAARMMIAGVVIGALTLVGYFYLPQYFELWMAAVGGGALVLGGIWLRSV